jgi:hypothetical protein
MMEIVLKLVTESRMIMGVQLSVVGWRRQKEMGGGRRAWGMLCGTDTEAGIRCAERAAEKGLKFVRDVLKTFRASESQPE